MGRTSKSREIHRTSPSLARLLKHYSAYARECMEESREIMPINEFYKVNADITIPRSLIYERYLRVEKKKEE